MPLRRRSPLRRAAGAPRYVVDVVISSGLDLGNRLREQGVGESEAVFKCVWPRFVPPVDAGILSFVRSESLVLQFGRLVAMHQVVPSAVPLPIGVVRNPEGEFVGYVQERIEGETFQQLVDSGALDEARRRLCLVEVVVARLHARSLPHGDLTAANIIAADDGRTVLIDPVAAPQPGTALQDTLCLRHLRVLLGG